MQNARRLAGVLFQTWDLTMGSGLEEGNRTNVARNTATTPGAHPSLESVITTSRANVKRVHMTPNSPSPASVRTTVFHRG